MLGKLHKMMAQGDLTPYLYRRCLGRICNLPEDMQKNLLSEATIMSGIGVSSEEDQKNFMYITMHMGKIAKEIASVPLTTDLLARTSSVVYQDRHNYPINTIYNFYKATERALKKMEIPIKKVAYPVGFWSVFNNDAPRDVSKWIQALRDIHIKANNGLSFNKAFEIVTSKWDTMEKHDFKAWERFYSERAQDKYKTAQVSDYYTAQDGSPLLPISDLKAKPRGFGMELPSHIEDEKRKQKEEQEIREAERKEQVAENRRKLLSRLNSAERIITDLGAQEDLNQAMDMGLDRWLEMLHTLKRSVQTAPVRSAFSPILHDLIIRQSNRLRSQGLIKSANMLEVLAQDAPKPPTVEELENPEEQDTEGQEQRPEQEPAANSSQESDPIAELEEKIDPMIDLKGEQFEEEEDGAMNDFVRMMNHEYLDDGSAFDEELVVEAQALPEPPQIPQEGMAGDMKEMAAGEVPSPHDEELVVEEEKPKDTMEMALKHVTIDDIIERLELVANIIQNREIPRQLSFVDMMMGEKNIAAFFPNLGEAIRSSLESHQYVYTRIEDILSKLRGSIEPSIELDLVPDREDEIPEDETLDSVRENLDRADEKDKERAKARKEKRELKEKAENALPITPEEISGPVEVEQSPPVEIEEAQPARAR